MQYIGQKDKNGKDIFEDYIVITDEAGWIGRVVYFRDQFMCIDNHNGYASNCNWEDYEIIGDYYNNPDLMKK